MLRRDRPAPSISAFPCNTGTVAMTPSTRLSAAASSSDSGRTLLTAAVEMPKVSVLPGTMAMRLVPNWVNSLST